MAHLALEESPPNLFYPHALFPQQLHADTLVILFLVVCRDPYSCHQASSDLDATGDSGCDITSEVPWIGGAGEGMEKDGEGKSPARD